MSTINKLRVDPPGKEGRKENMKEIIRNQEQWQKGNPKLRY